MTAVELLGERDLGLSELPRMVGPDSWPTSWGPAPRFSTDRTADRATYGPAVGRIANRLGIQLFPSQQWGLDVALEVLTDGSWAYEDVWDTEPRRSGKTFKLRPLIVHRCLMPGPPRGAWITAQKREKAVLRFEDIAKPLELSPMASEVRRLRSRSAERLEFLQTGSVLRPFAPNSEDEMHGEDPDIVVVDEWWSFDLADKEAIETGYKPAWSVKSGQAWLMSTAGTEESAWMNEGVALGRQMVLDGRTDGVAYFDWSIPDFVGGVPVDQLPDDMLLQLVWDHHPRRDHGLRWKYLADELTKSRVRFLRAYGNVRQEDERGEGIVPKDVWERQRSRAMIPQGARVGLGFEVDPLGRETSIYAGWRDPDTEVGVVELIERSAGQGWAAARLKALSDSWDIGSIVCVYSGPSRSVADTAGRLGVEILKIYTPDAGAASTRFLDDLTRGRQTHDELRDPAIAHAMKAATLHRLKTGPVVEPKGNEPVTAMNAAILAMWAADHLPPVPVRIPFEIS